MQQKLTAKQKVVSAATQLFAERGFHRTSMADLAEFAQVSVGAIYRAFPSKSEIIRAIILTETEEALEQLRMMIDRVRAGEVTGDAVVESLLTRWVSERSDALEHEVVAEGHRNVEIAAQITQICGQVRDLLRELARLMQPQLDEAEAEGVAEILLACHFGMGNREFTNPRLDAAQTATVVTRLLLRSLKP